MNSKSCIFRLILILIEASLDVPQFCVFGGWVEKV